MAAKPGGETRYPSTEIGSFARDLEVPESVYRNITKDKDKTFKVRVLCAEESVYSNIPGTKHKALKV